MEGLEQVGWMNGFGRRPLRSGTDGFIKHRSFPSLSRISSLRVKPKSYFCSSSEVPRHQEKMDVEPR